MKFAAFSMEFGTVASFVDLNHEPGKAYKAYVARLAKIYRYFYCHICRIVLLRLPLHCDQLKAYIDTLFCVVNAELKEIQDEREFQLIESRAVIFSLLIGLKIYRLMFSLGKKIYR